MGKSKVRTRKNKRSTKMTNITEERNENEPKIQANDSIELDEIADNIDSNNTNITESDNVETDTRQDDKTIQLTNN
ncbi:17895_t:CDS:2 [Rhizophagus irregularis]|nr:17895_t:CDS:2 [Rhizophagus irregularis]